MRYKVYVNPDKTINYIGTKTLPLNGTTVVELDLDSIPNYRYLIFENNKLIRHPRMITEESNGSS